MRNHRNLHYQSYLIRFWQDAERGPWRATLENPRTGEHKAFTSLDGLLGYLKAQTDEAGPPPPKSVEPES